MAWCHNVRKGEEAMINSPITDKSSKLPTLGSYLIMSGFLCTSGMASEKLEASDCGKTHTFE